MTEDDTAPEDADLEGEVDGGPAEEGGPLELSQGQLEEGIDLPTGEIHEIQLKSGFKFSS